LARRVSPTGQSNCSAGNTFLDALASYRQSLGLWANAVDLALIEDVGHVAEQGSIDSHFDKRQWMPILEGTLRQMLNLSILQQSSQPTSAGSSAPFVTGVAFPVPDDSELKREARFAYLFTAGSGPGAGSGDSGSGGNQTLRAFRMMHGGENCPVPCFTVTQCNHILHNMPAREPCRVLITRPSVRRRPLFLFSSSAIS
jgi:hypothetical protein